ncbi:hypothetical protein SD70_17520 [Gordoniibacillus kamchatkensis]|uniref:CidA/LrgA family protein n=1 Tax=Gordoniibacillus kamchatkensis TaxID=1590651 RepID=A0ABR5AFY7_9BACL|nr:CidA/LrgA family protein [Paenibacillus sp. VKM B-2647]KIL39860.1 hypothetical protein SD70_17520 [Paenibacillus sp. VKM B-2647]
MLGLVILLAFEAAGYAVRLLLHVPLPANVIGLILFTLALQFGLVRLAWVEAAAEFLVKHLMLFFAPVIVGTMAFWPYLKTQLLTAALSLTLSAFVVLLVTGKAMQLIGRRSRGEEREHKHEL